MPDAGNPIAKTAINIISKVEINVNKTIILDRSVFCFFFCRITKRLDCTDA
jgi:hypothetical protein